MNVSPSDIHLFLIFFQDRSGMLRKLNDFFAQKITTLSLFKLANSLNSITLKE